ncbi:MAG: hypothetical protein K0R57_4667 [Paenibacillaceae bacterium]|jgi:hypothetical protein|nr:hypothetical protein [Paenibacillaceae bacterium]
MKSLYIAATKSTPEVQFLPEDKLLQFIGQSYPENVFKFYEPVLQWVDEYLEQPVTQPLMIRIQIPYMNTSSTKCYMMMLEKFDDAYAAGKDVSLQWLYNPDNENELECAEEFKEDLSLPFHIIAEMK